MICEARKVAFGLMIALIGLQLGAGTSLADDFRWHGQSNEHGGKVWYGLAADHPEAAESTGIEITCYAFDRSVRLVIYREIPNDFEVGQRLIFTVVGGQPFEREAELAYWGYIGAMPSTWLWPDDLQTLMVGEKLEVMPEGNTSGFLFQADLTGVRALMDRYLRACIG